MKCLKILSLLVVLALSANASAREKPNVIILLVDDMGWQDFSCFGNSKAKTPNIDRLAAEGIRFDQFYVNAPICSPSRTSILTGQYAQRWKIDSYLDNRRSNAARGMANWLDPKAPTLSRILKSVGYATGHFGKWHLGGQRDVGDAPLITSYGFDTSLTSFEGLGPRVLPLLNKYDGSPPVRYSLGSETLGHGPIYWEDRSKVTTRYASAALDFIKKSEAGGVPFYVNLWPDDVHSPWNPPPSELGDRSPNSRYLGVLRTMDGELGPVLNYVEGDARLRNNTIIFVFSDNGSEPDAGSIKPFRGFKGQLFEGGIRSPLIVWGPGWVNPAKAGSANDVSILAAYDLTPSILSIVGVKPPADVIFDGTSAPQVILGFSNTLRKKPIFFRRPPDRKSFFGEKNLPDLAMRDGQWKFMCDYDGSREDLYDLDADVAERINLAASQPARVAEMKAALLAWNHSMPRAIDDHSPASGSASKGDSRVPSAAALHPDDQKINLMD